MMKIVGERAFGPALDGLDDMRKAKVKEWFEKSEVKFRAGGAPARGGGGGGMGGGGGAAKPAAVVKKVSRVGSLSVPGLSLSLALAEDAKVKVSTMNWTEPSSSSLRSLSSRNPNLPQQQQLPPLSLRTRKTTALPFLSTRDPDSVASSPILSPTDSVASFLSLGTSLVLLCR